MSNLRVLIAMDGSVHADYAFDYYLMHVHKPDNYVVILHAVEFSTPFLSMGVGNAALTNVIDEERMHAKKYIELLEQKLYAANLKGTVKQTFGPPRTEILHMAEEEHVNLIVTGTRGMGNVKRTFLGSVSDHVLHHAHVPVLVCRHKDH